MGNYIEDITKRESEVEEYTYQVTDLLWKFLGQIRDAEGSLDQAWELIEKIDDIVEDVVNPEDTEEFQLSDDPDAYYDAYDEYTQTVSYYESLKEKIEKMQYTLSRWISNLDYFLS